MKKVILMNETLDPNDQLLMIGKEKGKDKNSVFESFK